MDSLWLQCGVISIDHVAVTTTNLYQVLNDYMGIDGCELLRGPGTNNSQNVDYAFVKTSQGMVIEILGIKNNSPISEHVKKGGGAYHLCFLVHNLDEAVKIAQKNNAIKIVGQREDDAFDGRRVSFLMHPEHGLFEFLEAYPQALFLTNNRDNISTEYKNDVNDSAEKQIVIKAFENVFSDVNLKISLESAQLGVTPEWDSLKQLQIVMEIEKLAGIKLAVEELTSAICFDDFVQIVCAKINK